jgi:hypothetical protein
MVWLLVLGFTIRFAGRSPVDVARRTSQVSDQLLQFIGKSARND